MSDLKKIDKLKFEKLFEMGGGYVMDFSNKTFEDFILESVGKEIYSGKYENDSNSKAKLLRKFWEIENNYTVAVLNEALIEFWKAEKITSYSEISDQENILIQECVKIISRLKSDSKVEDISSINAVSTENDFSLLAKLIRESIEKNEPEAALDRLHTYMMKYIRKLCEKHQINISKVEPLNALFGKYTKHLIDKNLIESKMTESILRYSIGIIGAFNDIRNNKSFAHDNKILNYEESILIFKNITASKKFIDHIEIEFDRKSKNHESVDQSINDDDVPF